MIDERQFTMSENDQTTSEMQKMAFVVPAGEDRLQGPLDVFGNRISVKISSRDTGGAFAVVEGETPPMAGPPLHRHLAQDEWFHILEGEFLFEVDGQQMHAGPGDTVFAPRGSRHTFQNIGSTPARSIATVVPGGLDLFFEEVAAAAPAGTAPDIEKILPVFRKYGMELLGPPLAAREATAA